MAATRFLAKSMPSMRRLNPRFISTQIHLRQEPQLASEPPPQIPLPPNPASGSPLYNENWRNTANSYSAGADAARIPVNLSFLGPDSPGMMQSLSHTLDAKALMDQLAQWTTVQRWEDVKQLFELWIKSLDNSGKPNKPDVDLYNHYLRANLMMGASAGQLLDIVEHMDDYGISPTTASFNLVLKAMQRAYEPLAAEKLIERKKIPLRSGNAKPQRLFRSTKAQTTQQITTNITSTNRQSKQGNNETRQDICLPSSPQGYVWGHYQARMIPLSVNEDFTSTSLQGELNFVCGCSISCKSHSNPNK